MRFYVRFVLKVSLLARARTCTNAHRIENIITRRYDIIVAPQLTVTPNGSRGRDKILLFRFIMHCINFFFYHHIIIVSKSVRCVFGQMLL